MLVSFATVKNKKKKMPFQWLAVTKVYFLLILFVGCTLAISLFQAMAWLYVLIWGTQAEETVSV